MLPSKKTFIICKFLYYGNLAPVLEWHPILNQSWTPSCSASNGTINCTFEKACTEVNNPSLKAVRLTRHRPPKLEIHVCSGENGDEAAMLQSKETIKICKFLYHGNLVTKQDWLTLLNSRSLSCSASNGTINCTFEKACTEVNNPSLNGVRLTHHRPPKLEIYSGEN